MITEQNKKIRVIDFQHGVHCSWTFHNFVYYEQISISCRVVHLAIGLLKITITHINGGLFIAFVCQKVILLESLQGLCCRQMWRSHLLSLCTSLLCHSLWGCTCVSIGQWSLFHNSGPHNCSTMSAPLSRTNWSFSIVKAQIASARAGLCGWSNISEENSRWVRLEGATLMLLHEAQRNPDRAWS